MIDLDPKDIAFIFDCQGNLKDIYLPKDDSMFVPEIVIQIIELATGKKLDLS